MTIFDYLKDITVTKTGTLPLDNYVPFLVNRWLSFINPTVSMLINQVNFKNLLENKELHYRMMLTMFPRMKYCPKIQYIKKLKEEKPQDDKMLSLLSQKLELSQREILWLTEEAGK